MPLIKRLSALGEDLDTQRRITEYKIESLTITEEEEEIQRASNEVREMGRDGIANNAIEKKDLISLKTPEDTVSVSEEGIDRLHKKEMFNVLIRDVGLQEDETFLFSTFY